MAEGKKERDYLRLGEDSDSDEEPITEEELRAFKEMPGADIWLSEHLEFQEDCASLVSSTPPT